jgi:hypothetical protein
MYLASSVSRTKLIAVAGTAKLTLAIESSDIIAKKPTFRDATPPITRGLRTILESITINECKFSFSTSGSRFIPTVLRTSPMVLHIEVNAASLHSMGIIGIPFADA